VAGDHRVTGKAPVIVEHREIGVTDAAVGNLDFHLLGFERAGVILVGFERLAFAKRRIGFDRGVHKVKNRGR
jgi:hypothetical protein